MKKISCIIPAYNEEKNICRVLKVISHSPLISKIIVIDDGSLDKTSQVASQFSKVEVIKHEKNLGKGAALASGIEKAKDSEILIFLDSDLIGLKKEHLSQLANPIINNKADMTLGYLGKDIKRATNLASRLVKGISGQRALKKSFIEDVYEIRKTTNLDGKFWSRISGSKAVNINKRRVLRLDLKDSGFGADLIITRYIKKQKGKIRLVELKGLTQVMKEEKLSFSEASKKRVKMYWEIIKFNFFP